MPWYKDRDWIRNLDGIQGSDYSHSFAARRGSHYCPKCRVLLHVVKKTKIVNSESEEAKHFSFGGTQGNVKFTWDVFCCPKCDSEIAVGDILFHEKEQKKLQKKGWQQYTPSQAFYEVRAYDGSKKLVFRNAEKYEKADRLWQALVFIGMVAAFLVVWYFLHSAQ